MSDKVQRLLGRMRTDLRNVKPSAIRAFDQEVSDIPGIIKLTLGEPDFSTPEHIKNAAIRSIRADHSHYPQSIGTPGLRKAAANFLNQKYNLNYQPDNVIVTVGATEAISVAIGSVVNKGDRIIIPTPIWPMYIPIARMQGAEPIFIDTSADNYVLTPARLKKTLQEYGDSVKAVVLNFPSNPTGITYRREDTRAIAAVLAEYDVFVISDEIYSELTYGEPHVSVAEYLPEQTILINGVSKSHAMTGWRIGVICAPKLIVDNLFKLHQFSVTTATYVAQDAAQEAFENGLNDGQKMRQEYEKRGNYCYDQMKSMGFGVDKPQGAFYLFCELPDWFDEDEASFCHNLAYRNKVAVAAGSPFGPGGANHIRISYASSMTQLHSAMERIRNYLNDRYGN
ncbi:aminotransferase class I/II-fold pyridoxal phosphate-dependent enzyme [Paucilactobacillus suebicus]|uniref:Aminotransferase n=1 Tax=Paucilactobacillus suebicus DSM 5007 = KCTC 3549 TaxID=1423807 RepID=A0A0R1W6L7_9LACO|nr:aminotransferase class I/II-fold pyridoxal phosphate-dependent enzyme [Paucilactobacillus suebicus]KRM13045.1 bifunctional protein amino acid aminotransferase [Paucilactobacillus suebicus DSM 5007 = KCTC 3549]